MAGGNFWGDLIVSLRRDYGVSQRVLAERASVNRSYLRNIETGYSPADVATLERILDLFGYELEALERDGQHEARERLARDPKRKVAVTVNKLLAFRLPCN